MQQVPGDHLPYFYALCLRYVCIAVAGQIHKIQRFVDQEKINALCSARVFAETGDCFTKQRIDRAGFSDIGPADKCHLKLAVVEHIVRPQNAFDIGNCFYDHTVLYHLRVIVVSLQ